MTINSTPLPQRLSAAMHHARLHLLDRLLRTDDRGDVPGWVLVTVMTAGLVTALWLVADDQLTSVLGRAIGSVTQP
jgi:hypothetical protein